MKTIVIGVCGPVLSAAYRQLKDSTDLLVVESQQDPFDNTPSFPITNHRPTLHCVADGFPISGKEARRNRRKQARKNR